MSGERRCGDALRIGELPQREPRAAVNEREQRRLVRGNAERRGLAAQVPSEAKERRAKLSGRRMPYRDASAFRVPLPASN